MKISAGELYVVLLLVVKAILITVLDSVLDIGHKM